MKNIITIVAIVFCLAGCKTKAPEEAFKIGPDPLAEWNAPKPRFKIHQYVSVADTTMRVKIETVLFDIQKSSTFNLMGDPSFIQFSNVVDTSKAEAEKKRQWNACEQRRKLFMMEVRRVEDSIETAHRIRRDNERALSQYLTPIKDTATQ